MHLTPRELKERVILNYDPDEVVELLDLSTEDILDRFEDILWERKHKFGECYEEILFEDDA